MLQRLQAKHRGYMASGAGKGAQVAAAHAADQACQKIRASIAAKAGEFKEAVMFLVPYWFPATRYVFGIVMSMLSQAPDAICMPGTGVSARTTVLLVAAATVVAALAAMQTQAGQDAVQALGTSGWLHSASTTFSSLHQQLQPILDHAAHEVCASGTCV
jgi:hypothetical protein